MNLKRLFCLHLTWTRDYQWHPAMKWGFHIHKCLECGKRIKREPWNQREVPESKYWYSVDFGPTFTEVFCNPTCMLIRHYERNDQPVPTWLINI